MFLFIYTFMFQGIMNKNISLETSSEICLNHKVIKSKSFT